MKPEEIKKMCSVYLENCASIQKGRTVSDKEAQLKRKQMMLVETFLEHMEKNYGMQVRDDIAQVYVYGIQDSIIPRIKADTYLLLDAMHQEGIENVEANL